ncbi:MAG: AAA family ATPase, partial [Candidatus Heimdallarchaeota archaeon]
DLEITNFQSHKNTILEFHPGTNVILGQSDVGKSSIIRAINWAVSNRPSGDSFRANFSKSNTEVGIEFNSGYIVREKGKVFNGYVTEKDSYKALRTDVPQEIKDITQMQEVNIQPQYKSYFLLDETPGNVAKAFNSVSGLEEMDASLKNINSKVRATSSALAINLKETVAIEEQIKSMKWLSPAEKKLQKIEEEEAGLQRTFGICNMVKELVGSIIKQQSKLKELPDFSALPKIKEIFELDQNIDEKINSTNKIHDLLESLSKLQTKQKRYNVLDSLDLSSTAEISQQIAALSSNVLSIFSVKETISEKQQMLSRNEIEIKERGQALSELEDELDICPTCGQIIQEVS